MNVLYRMEVASISAKILMVATFVNVKKDFFLMEMQKPVQVSLSLKLKSI